MFAHGGPKNCLDRQQPNRCHSNQLLQPVCEASSFSSDIPNQANSVQGSELHFIRIQPTNSQQTDGPCDQAESESQKSKHIFSQKIQISIHGENILHLQIPETDHEKSNNPSFKITQAQKEKYLLESITFTKEMVKQHFDMNDEASLTRFKSVPDIYINQRRYLKDVYLLTPIKVCRNHSFETDKSFQGINSAHKTHSGLLANKEFYSQHASTHGDTNSIRLNRSSLPDPCDKQNASASISSSDLNLSCHCSSDSHRQGCPILRLSSGSETPRTPKHSKASKVNSFAMQWLSGCLMDDEQPQNKLIRTHSKHQTGHAVTCGQQQHESEEEQLMLLQGLMDDEEDEINRTIQSISTITQDTQSQNFSLAEGSLMAIGIQKISNDIMAFLIKTYLQPTGALNVMLLYSEAETDEKGMKLHRVNCTAQAKAITTVLRNSKRKIQLCLLPAYISLLDRELEHQVEVFHFCGHGIMGQPSSLLFVQDVKPSRESLKPGRTVTAHELVGLLSRHRNTLKVVFLGCCHSESVGALISKLGVMHIICIENKLKISDTACRQFAAYFYESCLVSHRPICDSFHFAKAQLHKKGKHTPLECEKFILISNHEGKCSVLKTREGLFMSTGNVEAQISKTEPHIAPKPQGTQLLDAYKTNQLLRLIECCPRGLQKTQITQLMDCDVDATLQTLCKEDLISTVSKNNSEYYLFKARRSLEFNSSMPEQLIDHLLKRLTQIHETVGSLEPNHSEQADRFHYQQLNYHAAICRHFGLNSVLQRVYHIRSLHQLYDGLSLQMQSQQLSRFSRLRVEGAESEPEPALLLVLYLLTVQVVLKEHPPSTEYLITAIKSIRDKGRNFTVLGNYYKLYGLIRFSQGRFNDARLHLCEASRLFAETGCGLGLATCEAALGYINMSHREYALACHNFKNALDYYVSIAHWYGEYYMHYWLFVAKVSIKRPQELLRQHRDRMEYFYRDVKYKLIRKELFKVLNYIHRAGNFIYRDTLKATSLFVEIALKSSPINRKKISKPYVLLTKSPIVGSELAVLTEELVEDGLIPTHIGRRHYRGRV